MKSLRRTTTRGLAPLLALALVAACGEFTDVIALATSMQNAYPGANVAVNVDNGHRIVTVSFAETSRIDGLPIEEAEEEAREISRFVVAHYDGERAIDELVVVFEGREETPDGGSVSQRAEFRFTPDALGPPAPETL